MTSGEVFLFRTQRPEVRILSGTTRYPFIFRRLDFPSFQPELLKLNRFGRFRPRHVHTGIGLSRPRMPLKEGHGGECRTACWLGPEPGL